ncbi:MAG: cyclase family protein [Saprospiraceae bacterium]|uniref:Cyclase family protein n=1 Tax=Candidatus Opimibacter skivensis TaxID=2982028 RepID=A0A9D7SY21_9BACT|nr:cyclase family protein [Candidatus Opimibacter skivensis]
MEYIDLSHTVFDGLITYKGLPAPVICDYLSREASKSFYEEGTSFQIGRIDMVANTGTYIDCPSHRYHDGHDLSEIHIDQVANLPAILINALGHQAIGPEFFFHLNLTGKAILVHTGWSMHWNTTHYFSGHPFLTEAAAVYLKENGVVLVGIDSHNIDDTSGNRRPVHSILLGANILIVEHLTNLDQIPASEFLFSAVPPKVKGMGTFPVRAFATKF